jgi:hypothetical protein
MLSQAGRAVKEENWPQRHSRRLLRRAQREEDKNKKHTVLHKTSWILMLFTEGLRSGGCAPSLGLKPQAIELY